jgi:biotin---protein ligase
MNILVYSGPETVQTSLSHTLSVLRSLALPNYTVQAITNQSLVNHPWTTSCALLVLPGCRNWYSPSTVAPIRSYVEGGGSLLAFGAGLRSSRGLTSSFATFSLGQEIPSLKFQDRKSGTAYYPIFQSDDAPKEVSVEHDKSEIIQIIRTSQDRLKIEVDDAPSAEVLARYEGEEEVAAVSCDVGQGKLVIWSPSLEYPTTSNESKRWDILHHSLTLLRLQLPDSTQRTFSSRPLPLFLTGSPSIPGIVSKVVQALSPPPPPTDLRVFVDENDKFHFHDDSEVDEVLRRSHTRFKNETDPNLWQPKDIIVYRDGQLPTPDQTPLFDITKYYEYLAEAKTRFGLRNEDTEWSIGDAFMYSEIVTSTQTMLDKYDIIPHGLYKR